MTDEEKEAIEEQYKKGLVNLSNVIEPLINQFKTDYSLDIQQCRLIINYLLMERDFNETYYDELDKEIEELKEKKGYHLGFIDGGIAKKYEIQDKIKAKIEEIDIEIQCCEYADDDTEEYKKDMEKEKRRLLRDKKFLQSLLEKE